MQLGTGNYGHCLPAFQKFRWRGVSRPRVSGEAGPKLIDTSYLAQYMLAYYRRSVAEEQRLACYILK